MPAIKLQRRNCDHLKVSIKGVARAFSKATQSRTLRGVCNACGKIVEREQTANEIATGIFGTYWK